MTSSTYVVTTGSSRAVKENMVFTTDNKQNVIDYLEALPLRGRDSRYVNGQVGSEWLFDNRGAG